MDFAINRIFLCYYVKHEYVVIIMEQEDFKQFIDGLDALMDKHADDLQQLMEYILEDMIDSYDALIQQRQQTIDKYIKLISIILRDKRDINKPIQSMMDKKHNDVAELQKEIAPIKEFKDVLLSDEIPSEDEFEKILDKIKNI